jgi:glycosyltransferase involved in cell wall biosynthesis
MRILVSTPTFLPIVGGAEMGIHELYHRLGRNHEVTILTPQLPRHVLEHYGSDDYSSDNYQVRYIAPVTDNTLSSLPTRILKRTSLLYTAQLTHLVRRERPDLLNFHFIKPHGSSLVLLRQLYGVPVVLSLVGRSDVLELLSPFKTLYANIVISRSDLILANSSYYLGADCTNPRLRVIPYGVDTTEFSPSRRRTSLRHELGIADDDFMLFTMQRLAPVKRVDALIKMMVEVVRNNPRVVLVIGGKGEEEASLRDLAHDLNLTSNVRFIGYVESDRLPTYFASSDAFVFHSVLETFGVVFAQAMASGLPIVAADTSCISHVLHDTNGFLVPPFDSPAFANAVLALANQRDLASRIGMHNRERAVQEFDWDLIASLYEQAIHDLIRGFPR